MTVTAAATLGLVGLLFEGFSTGDGDGSNYNSYGYGGAVLLHDSSGAAATVSSCTFRGNDADQAGAIYTSSGTTLTVTACIFDANHASSFGGAIYFSGATLAITASTFTANTTHYYPDSTAVQWYAHSPVDYTNEAANVAFGGGATNG